jgi:aminoglycoside/choline kinase family phosphotransferase
MTRVPACHADLYRLRTADEAAELGLADLARDHVVLVEWPDRLGQALSADQLRISLTGRGESRTAVLTAEGQWARALARNESITSFLQGSVMAGARRDHLEGDASARRYERLTLGARTALLMDMPRRPDGPPVQDGLPYSAIAHLAEDISAVVAVNDELEQRGFGAPHIHDADLGAGLAVIEFLEGEVYGSMRLAGQDMAAAMEAATEVLAAMAAQDWPASPRVRGGSLHTVSPYDERALLIEADLLPSWYLPHCGRPALDDAARNRFHDAWRAVLPPVLGGRHLWTLRDFHSPNLIWMPERQGLKRVGLIDTQDAVLGHPAYDLVSLLQDARVDVPEDEEGRLLDHYVACRSGEAGFDETEFRLAYAILGAQRATKILGIFARLSRRDGKHGYLRHMPRVAAALRRNLRHPRLRGLRAWYQSEVPTVVDEGAAP